MPEPIPLFQRPIELLRTAGSLGVSDLVGEEMTRRTWSPPVQSPQGGAASPAASAPSQSQQQGREYARKFIRDAIFFGVIGILFWSWFPVALGAFLFFADEDFIEWALAKIGIRFVPDTLGPAFIDTFVFLAGTWALLTTWKDSAPAWLLPPAGTPWPVIVAIALACAVLKIISTTVIKKVLPRRGIELTPYRQSLAIIGLTGLGILALFICASIFHWFGVI
jgi:hypothetical protein